MSIAQMRDILMRMYGPSWARRVEAMPDHQIASIYNRMLANNKL